VGKTWKDSEDSSNVNVRLRSNKRATRRQQRGFYESLMLALQGKTPDRGSSDRADRQPVTQS